MNAIVQPKTFEERMKDRIKDSIGDLVDDDALKTLIEKGIQSAFFEKRIKVSSSRGSSESEKVSLMEDIVRECVSSKLTSMVNTLVDTWVKDNPDKINEILNQVVTRGVGSAVIAAFDHKLSGQLASFQYNIQQMLAPKPY